LLLIQKDYTRSMGEWKHDGLATPGQVVLAHEPSFTLGQLRIDPATRQVQASDRSETLEPRVMQVLVALARVGGAIVTRYELTERCWDGRIVGEDAINRALSRIRHVAAGIGAGSFTIETITKVGYRLVGQGSDEFRGRPGKSRSAAPDRSICVLPFANMSGDAEQEYFSDGITEDITTDLSKVSALAVTARNTAFTLKGQAVDVREVARKLGVSHVLEGSVRRAGNQLRISAQLIDGATGDHVWAERYDRDLTDIFAIQDEISRAVVDALKLRLLPQEKQAIEQRGTSSAEAYDLYLMARQYRVTGDFGERRREDIVIRLCTRATDIDPRYAQAWALMALAQANRFRGYAVDQDSDDGAVAADRALALDPGIAEARLPKAWRLAVHGRVDEANAELAIALRLGADSWEVNREAARLFYRQRRMKEAARCYEKATELVETDFQTWGMLAACYTAVGNKTGLKRCAEKILDRVENGLAREPDNGAALALGSLSFAVLGQEDRSRNWMERALLLDSDNQYMWYTLAWSLLTTGGDAEAAKRMLERCLASAGTTMVWLAANDPNLDSLRGDPRFTQMLASAIERSNLPQSAIVSGPVN
jgi:adenylate cyclase